MKELESELAAARADAARAAGRAATHAAAARSVAEAVAEAQGQQKAMVCTCTDRLALADPHPKNHLGCGSTGRSPMAHAVPG